MVICGASGTRDVRQPFPPLPDSVSPCSLSLDTTDEQLEIFYGEENSGMSMAPSFQFLLVLVMILPGQKRQEEWQVWTRTRIVVAAFPVTVIVSHSQQIRWAKNSHTLMSKDINCTLRASDAPLQQMTGKAPFSVMEVGLIHHGSHGWHCQDAGHAPITSSMAPTVGFSSRFTWEERGIEHHQSRIQIYWNSRLMQAVSWQSSNWQLLRAPIPASEKPADWEE